MNEQQRAVVQQALEAFTTLRGACAAAGWLTDSEHIAHMDDSREAITALRQLLEQPVQEPVAEYRGLTRGGHYILKPMGLLKIGMLLYAPTPAQPAESEARL